MAEALRGGRRSGPVFVVVVVLVDVVLHHCLESSRAQSQHARTSDPGLSLPTASTIRHVMDELEEREGADFGAQCLFAASSTERLHSEDCRAQKLVEAWSLSNFEVGTQATIAPFSDVTPLIQQYLRELCRSWLRYRAPRMKWKMELSSSCPVWRTSDCWHCFQTLGTCTFPWPCHRHGRSFLQVSKVGPSFSG